MIFLNYPYNLNHFTDTHLLSGCSTQSLLRFLLTHYRISKEELAGALEVSLPELETLLNNENIPDDSLKEKILILLK